MNYRAKITMAFGESEAVNRDNLDLNRCASSLPPSHMNTRCYNTNLYSVNDIRKMSNMHKTLIGTNAQNSNKVNFNSEFYENLNLF